MYPQQSEGKKKLCGILGATGTVGQRFISLIGNVHPQFTIHALGASPRSAGKSYRQAVNWKLAEDPPSCVHDIVVSECKPEEKFLECDIVFSGLDAEIAGDIEMAFLKANIPIFSNAKNHRRGKYIPLVVPTVNIQHIRPLLEVQRKHYGLNDKGLIVTNANCSTTGLVVPLKALQDAFGPLSKVSVVTMQAVSGAGYPGVPSLDILDNVVPYISGEEEKMEFETLKILGSANALSATGFDMQPNLAVSVQCNRVPVLDGHLLSVSVTFSNPLKPSISDIISTFESYTTVPQKLLCPSAPKKAIHVLHQPDRPQPRLDRMREGGYGVSVGRVRKDESGLFDIKMTVLVHNTVLGAAGSSLMIAEWAVLEGLL